MIYQDLIINNINQCLSTKKLKWKVLPLRLMDKMALSQGQPTTEALTIKWKALNLRSQTGIERIFVRTAYELSNHNDQQYQLINSINVCQPLHSINTRTKRHPMKLRIRIPRHSGLEKLFLYHKDRVNIINIIQQGSRYHLYSIEEKTRKSYLDAMILRGNHK